jgi:hypothetical protein
MALTKEQIRQIAEQTRSSILGGTCCAPAGNGQCLFDDVHDAIDTAIRAQQKLMDMSLEERGKLIEAMRQTARDHAEELSILAHEETGYGKVHHKIAKNLLAANKTPGIEDLHPTAFSGDDGLTVPFISCGAVGLVSVTSNVAPAEMKALVDAALSGDGKKALELQKKYYPLMKGLMSLDVNPVPVKAALALRGNIGWDIRLPLVPLAEEKHGKLAGLLKSFNLM